MAYGYRQELRKPVHSLIWSYTGGSQDLTNFVTLREKLGVAQFLDPLPVKGQVFRPGIFRINPVVISKYVANSVPGSGTIDFGSGSKYTWTGDTIAAIATSHSFNYPVSGSKDVDAGNRCVTRAYARMSTPSNDIGLLLAEARETLTMLANPLKGFRSLLFNMAKGRRKAGLMRHLADQWLEYRYGLTPAVSDISMLLSMFKSKVNFDANKLFRASGSELKYPTTSRSSYWFYPTQYVTGKYTTEVVTQMKVNATLYYRRSASPSYALGLSLSDIPNLIWELTPFSFVVDWVFNIGDWLRSHVSDPSCAPLGCCLSFKEVKTWTSAIDYWRYNNWPQGQVSPVGGTYTEVQTTLKRELWTSAPMLPSVSREIVNLNRSLDSLSLIWKPVERLLQNSRRQ